MPLPHFRLLVIDDNPAIHEDFRKILIPDPSSGRAWLDKAEEALFGDRPPEEAAQTYTLDAAFQGQDGLGMVERALAEGKPYALVFVDVRMPPGWDGIYTVERMNAVDPDLQMVICTAYSDYSWEEINRRMASTDHFVILKKPFDTIEVQQLAHVQSRKWETLLREKKRLWELENAVEERNAQLQGSQRQLQEEIGGRRRMEEALQASEERFSKAFHHTPLPMAIQRSRDKRYADVNGEFQKMLGLPRQEIVGKTPAELKIVSYFENKARDLSGAYHNVECRLQIRGGEMHRVLLSVEQFSLGNEPHMLVIIEDMTERHDLEDRLRQSQKMEAIGALATGVAHDFNNLLHVIQGHASAYSNNESLEPEERKSFSEIALASERGTQLTRQLLLFSRKQKIKLQKLDLIPVFQENTGLLQRLIGRQIDFGFDFPPALPPVWADSGCITQILMNLSINARDAMPKGGRLRIALAETMLTPTQKERWPTARPGAYVTITVADTGTGMDKETTSRIFEPFFTTKEAGKGTGMGLATVYGIVQQHHGWIDVESALNLGTKFTIYLPVYDGKDAEQSEGERPQEGSGDPFSDANGIPAPAPPAAPSAPAPKRSLDMSGQTVLVVDDEAAVRLLLRHMLRPWKCRVLEAGDGKEARELWAQHQGSIALLLTDIMLPGGINGDTLAAEFAAERPGLPVIYSSGFSPDVLRQEGVLREDAFYLPKPYDAAKLNELLEEIMSKKSTS